MTSVLHFHNPAGVASHLSREQQDRGIESDVVVTHDPFNYGYDYKLSRASEGSSLPEKFLLMFDQFYELVKIAKNYDILHFHVSSSLDYRKPFYPRGIDDPIYQLLGVRVILHYHGSNVRHTGDPLLHQVFADRRLVSTPDLLRWVKNAKWIPNPIDIGNIPHPGVDQNGPPYTVCHAPTNREIKGTDEVIDTVESLRKSGYNIELDLVESVSREEALQRFASADIIVDQLNLGWYGMVSIEALSLGKPTCVYIDSEVVPKDFNSPLVNVNQSNLYDKLQLLIENPEYRQELGKRGRRFVENTHHPKVVAQQVEDVYQQVL